jgi:membrane protease YdiL (CAAX protease family)
MLCPSLIHSTLSLLVQAPVPAQAPAAAAEPEATVGMGIAGMLLLLALGGSIWMMSVWSGRRRTTGHFLPAAQRGVLRVPLALTAVAVLFAVLMLLMLLLTSVIDPKADPKTIAANAQTSETANAAENAPTGDAATSTEVSSVEPEDSASAEPSSGEKPTAKKPTEEDLKRMRRMMWMNIEFELILFAVFGIFVWLARSHGRVRLPDSNAETNSLMIRPEIDDVETKELAPDSLNPFAPPQADDARDVAMSGVVMDLTPAEPFSMLQEVRFAGEVFLASYLPTTMLRVVVVSLYTSVVGEDPGQHELLEMLKSGVDATLMTMIAVTAVLLAPIVEELQFRVVILGGLAQRGQAKMALVLSSILFGLVHGIPDGLALLPLAFALGYTYLRRRSYITVILVHFFFNAFNMLVALLMLI